MRWLPEENHSLLRHPLLFLKAILVLMRYTVQAYCNATISHCPMKQTRHNFLSIISLCLKRAIVVIVAATFISAPAFAKSDEETAGDIGSFIPTLVGVGASIFKNDPEGLRMLMRSTAVTMLATEGLKYSFDNTSLGKRPNGGSESFPSGHTALACSGAAFDGNRYGWQYELSMLAIATGVGISRVDAHKHHWYDVVAGCALGYGVNQFFVTKIGEERIYPVIGPKIIGFRGKLGF